MPKKLTRKNRAIQAKGGKRKKKLSRKATPFIQPVRTEMALKGGYRKKLSKRRIVVRAGMVDEGGSRNGSRPTKKSTTKMAVRGGRRSRKYVQNTYPTKWDSGD